MKTILRHGRKIWRIYKDSLSRMVLLLVKVVHKYCTEGKIHSRKYKKHIGSDQALYQNKNTSMHI